MKGERTDLTSPRMTSEKRKWGLILKCWIPARLSKIGFRFLTVPCTARFRMHTGLPGAAETMPSAPFLAREGLGFPPPSDRGVHTIRFCSQSYTRCCEGSGLLRRLSLPSGQISLSASPLLLGLFLPLYAEPRLLGTVSRRLSHSPQSGVSDRLQSTLWRSCLESAFRVSSSGPIEKHRLPRASPPGRNGNDLCSLLRIKMENE